MDKPAIIVALISGAVVLIIAIFKGVYRLQRDRANGANIGKNLLSKKQAEKFIEASRSYQTAFVAFNGHAVQLQNQNHGNEMPLLQLCTNFFADHAKGYYEENSTYLDSGELTKLFESILSKLNWNSINDESDPKRTEVLRELGTEIIAFCKSLHGKAIEY